MKIATIFRLLFPVAILIGAAVPAIAAPDTPDLKKLPEKIAKQCHSPKKWVVVVGDEVHVRPPSDANYDKVDCVLAELKASGVTKLGFVGNEIDPNQILTHPWHYIAGGSAATLTNLSLEAKKAGWLVDALAKANDGTGYLSFRTPDGMTVAQAEVFTARLYRHEFGDIVYGPAPTKDGGSYEGN